MAREIDKAIASLLQWSDLYEIQTWEDNYLVGSYETTITLGTDADGHEQVLPNWQSNANAALSLVELVPATFRLQSTAPGIWQATFMALKHDYQATEATPELAICEAWRKWKMAETESRE